MPAVGKRKRSNRPQFDSAVGEDDLYAGDLTTRLWRRLLYLGVFLALLGGVGLGVLLTQAGDKDKPDTPSIQVENIPTSTLILPTPLLTATPRDTVEQPSNLFVTATPPAEMLFMPTVTPAPPTSTETPTPGPCMKTAGPGDTVLGMAMECGHRDMAVIDLILEINDMETANELQLGQTLEIPWPTPTPGADLPTADPNGSATTDAGTGGGSETMQPAVNEFGTPDVLATYQSVEPTLRPGLAWHTVVLGETITSLVFMYNTDVETLSQINPQIDFLQCDYGSPTGGDKCSVMLSEGQQVRVPVPLPTATLSPTPVGTRTPTPTATATFNAPFADSPANEAHFNADQIVTLRWGTTGTLGPEERYIVRVTDRKTGDQYVAALLDTMYVLPGGWQPDDGSRHTFEWTISVGRLDAQNHVVDEAHITTSRRFTWDSR
jgi:hypothetical protein